MPGGVNSPVRAFSGVEGGSSMFSLLLNRAVLNYTT